MRADEVDMHTKGHPLHEGKTTTKNKHLLTMNKLRKRVEFSF